MPAANISADLRQAAVNSGDFHIRSFNTISSRDATAGEGTIRTDDIAFVAATGFYYRWDGAAFQPHAFPSDGASAFVFRPGGVDGDNVFTDFSALWTAVQAVEGLRTVLVDSSLSGNLATIPAGAYDFEGSQIDIQVAPAGSTVDLADGVTFANTPKISGVGGNFFNLTSRSTSPIVTAATEVRLSNCIVRAEGGSVFFEIAAGFQTIYLDGATTNFGNALGKELWDIAAGATGTVFLANSATFGNRTTTGLGTLTLVPAESSGSFDPDDPAQLFTGTISVFYGGKAERVGYTPAVTGDWTGADPVNVREALDRIAAMLGPIA